MSDRAVVLLSGGMDSAVTAAIAKQAHDELFALTIAYGQRHGIEVERAQAVARQLELAEHRVMELDLSAIARSALTDRSIEVPVDRDHDEIGEGIPSTYVPARNTIFLSLALAWAETLGAAAIYLGANVTDYSGYPDCRPEFIAAFQALAAQATQAGVEGAAIRVETPLMRASKAQIVDLAGRYGVDLTPTISCYRPGATGTVCGRCDACQLRAKGFSEAERSDPSIQH